MRHPSTRTSTASRSMSARVMIGAREDSAASRRTPVRMARTGESHAVFVVQRSFRRVRKGYDPEEVERHLQLVSEWFTKTHAGESAREWEQSHRERLEADATLEGARLKAEAMTREAAAELARAREEAAVTVDHARAGGGGASRAAHARAGAAAIGDRARLDAAAAETIRAAADLRAAAEAD